MSDKLLEAAKKYRSEYCRDGDSCQATGHELEIAIVESEQQAVDDALPITPGWMQSEFSDTVNWSSHLGFFLSLPCCSIKWNHQREVLVINGVDVPHIKTRGQLRRLAEPLKGGE